MSVISDQSTALNSDSLIFPRQVGGDKKGNISTLSICKKNRGSNSSSIPSKFSTTLLTPQMNRGFGSSEGRFLPNFIVENPTPGPGNYTNYSDNTFEPSKPSYSVKGYGNFVSQNSRLEAYGINSGPGPGAYTGAHTGVSTGTKSVISFKGDTLPPINNIGTPLL